MKKHFELKKYLEFFKLHKDEVNRELLDKMFKEMEVSRFNPELKKYKNKYNNNAKIAIFINKNSYEELIHNCTIADLKSILFNTSKTLVNDKNIEISEYIEFYIFALNRLEEKEDDFSRLCLTQVCQWTKGVILQGHRVLNSKRSFENSRIEEHFFAIALGKSIKFIDRMKSSENEEIKKAAINISKFIDKKIGLRKIRDFRNMREHDDAYFEGDGRNPSRFIEQSEDGFIQADATSTICICNDNEQDKIYLGNKVEVNNVIEVYKRILPVINLVDKIINYIYYMNSVSEDKPEIQELINNLKSKLIECVKFD